MVEVTRESLTLFSWKNGKDVPRVEKDDKDCDDESPALWGGEDGGLYPRNVDPDISALEAGFLLDFTLGSSPPVPTPYRRLRARILSALGPETKDACSSNCSRTLASSKALIFWFTDERRKTVERPRD